MRDSEFYHGSHNHQPIRGSGFSVELFLLALALVAIMVAYFMAVDCPKRAQVNGASLTLEESSGLQPTPPSESNDKCRKEETND